MSELAELARSLVAIDSVNPELVPGGAGEAEVAGAVGSWLERAGLDVTVEELAPGRPNVVGVARGTGGGRTLLLNAHTDTVGTAAMRHPGEARLEGGRLWGRGAYDMKGALAAIMVAGARAREARLRGDVVVAAVIDEEVASLGTTALVERHTADGAIVAEPTEELVCVAHKGFVAFEVETRGRAAHGSRPDLGVDAIARMGHVLVGIERLDAELRADPRHPLLGSGSIHASLIEGGQEYSSYPARCLLRGERRTIPGETREQVEAELARARRRPGRADRAAVRPRAVRGRRGRAGRRRCAPARGRRRRRGRRLLGRLGAARRGRDPERRLRPARQRRALGGRVGRPRVAGALSGRLYRCRPGVLRVSGPLSLGLLSTAKINGKILAGAAGTDAATVVAVASREPERARAYAAEHGLERWHGGYEALLADPEVDAVYVSLPNSLHVEWSIRALEAGKHVLCEKPLTRRPEEAERAFDAAERAGRVLMEAFMWRHHPQTKRLAELVAEDAIGELRLVRAEFGFSLKELANIRLRPDLDGGALMDVGCYCVSAARLLAGEPERFGAVQTLSGSGVDVRFAGATAHAGGVLAHFECALDVPSRAGLEVVGSDGSIVVGDPWHIATPGLELRRGGAVERVEARTCRQLYGSAREPRRGGGGRRRPAARAARTRSARRARSPGSTRPRPAPDVQRGSAPQSAAPTAPACGPSVAGTISIRSSGATFPARRCTSVASGRAAARPASATPPPITTRCGARKMVRFATAIADQRARARAAPRRAAGRLRAPPPRRRRRVACPPRARSPAHPRAARGSRGCRSCTGGPSSSTVWWPISPARVVDAEVEPAAEHEPAADAGPADDAHHVLGAAAAPSRASASANACPSLTSATGCPNPASSSVREGLSVPVAVEVREEQRAALAVEEPGERDPDRVRRRRPGAPARPSGASTPSGPPTSERVGVWSVSTSSPSSSSASLTFVPPTSRPSAAHRAVQPPSTVSTAPVTNGAVAR